MAGTASARRQSDRGQALAQRRVQDGRSTPSPTSSTASASYAESTATPRLMLHAHGGLVDEKSALEYAHRAPTRGGWHHGVYPVYFIWETGAFEMIKNRLGLGRGLGDWWDRRFERFARPLGRPLWDDMKDYALKSSAADAGGGEAGGARIFAQALRTLLASPPGGKPIALHAVGHSAGAIFHSHFVPMLIDGVDAGRQPGLAGASGADRPVQADGRAAPGERQGRTLRDVHDGRGGRKRRRPDRAARDTGLWQVAAVSGVQRLRAGDEEGGHSRTGRALRADPDITDLFKPTGAHRLEFSHAKGKPHNPATHARMHGCFDNDDATMRSVLETITGLPTTVAFPDQGRELRQGVVACAGRGLRRRPGRLDVASAPHASASRRLDRPAHDARSASASTAIPRARSPAAFATRRRGREALRGLALRRHHAARPRGHAAAGARCAHALVDSARAGDSLVFQYSGHGTQAEDLNGDESDRYDEALVPIDYTSGALLLDDDLADVYRRLPDGAVLTLFMDCCHSGTNSRFAPIDRSAASRRRATPVPRADPRSRGGAPAIPRRHAARRTDERGGVAARTHSFRRLPGQPVRLRIRRPGPLHAHRDRGARRGGVGGPDQRGLRQRRRGAGHRPRPSADTAADAVARGARSARAAGGPAAVAPSGATGAGLCRSDRRRFRRDARRPRDGGVVPAVSSRPARRTGVSDWERDDGRVHARLGTAQGARPEPYRRKPDDPVQRVLRVYTQDPGTSKSDGAIAEVELPWEPVGPGTDRARLRRPRHPQAHAVTCGRRSTWTTSASPSTRGCAPSTTNPRFRAADDLRGRDVDLRAVPHGARPAAGVRARCASARPSRDASRSGRTGITRTTRTTSRTRPRCRFGYVTSSGKSQRVDAARRLRLHVPVARRDRARDRARDPRRHAAASDAAVESGRRGVPRGLRRSRRAADAVPLPGRRPPRAGGIQGRNARLCAAHRDGEAVGTHGR